MELGQGNAISLSLALTQPGLSNLTLASAPFFHHLGRRILTTHTICLGLRESYFLNDRNAGVRESLL